MLSDYLWNVFIDLSYMCLLDACHSLDTLYTVCKQHITYIVISAETVTENKTDKVTSIFKKYFLKG